jgi:isocitrate dehydrogenase (NAD+)
VLKHIGEREAADRLFKATAAVIAEGKNVTYDLGGTIGTSQMAEAIVEKTAHFS